MARVFISHSSRDNAAADRLKAWLGDQGFETPFLDFDKHAGIPVGANWEQTLYREIERSEAVIIVHTANWMDSKWCFAEFTQARALGKPIFPVIETPSGETLIAQDIQSLNLQSDRDGGLAQLAGELTEIALDSQGGFAWEQGRPPYPGLLAFTEADAPVYFGRDDEIRRLIERLNARRAQGGVSILALLGASGSGKSSLLRAGVVPRLKRDQRNWVVLQPIRPQPDPIEALAVSLAIAHDRGGGWRLLRERLNGPEAVRHLRDQLTDIQVARGAGNASILLPVDQAEELFTVVAPAAADRFLELLSAAAAGELPLLTVLALRSDFLGRLQQASHLTARFEEFSLGPLPKARFRQVIEGPARIGGLEVDEELVARAVADAETDDALPLLAFALRELYDRHGGDGRLTLEEYLSLGDPGAGLTPLENAVRRAADTALAEANPESDELAGLRSTFVQSLVMVNQDGDYARRRARWADLPTAAHRLLERFAAARLLVLGEEKGERVVEVAHEALLRKWPQLTAWLDEAREFLIGRQQLDRDLDDWRAAPADKRSAALLSGLKLERAKSWLLARGDQLTEEQRRFIEASSDHALREAKRKRAVRAWTMRAAVVALLIMSGLAYWANDQRLKAEAAEARALDETIYTQLPYQLWRTLDGGQIKDANGNRAVPGPLRRQSGGRAKAGTIWHNLFIINNKPVIASLDLARIAADGRAGRVIAFGHESLLVSDKIAGFLDDVFRWLSRSKPNAVVRLTTGHGEILGGSIPFANKPAADDLIADLRARGFAADYETADLIDLADIDVLVIGNAWCSFSAPELVAIDAFVRRGGGLALGGLGWSWRDYHQLAPCWEGPRTVDIADYPMNQLGALFGIAFGTEAIL